MDREDGGRYHGGRHHDGREPFLGRWLFSPRLLIVVVVIALGVGLGLGGWWLTSGRFVQVPSVSNDSVTQATAVLTADGFAVKQGRVHSNSVPSGSVTGTSPAGRVSKGSTITSYLERALHLRSTRGEERHAHRRESRPAERAPDRHHAAGWLGGLVGTVVGTNPPAGTTWPQTKTVTILISGGLQLPDFSGENFQTAQQWANQHGVTLQQQPDNNSQQPQGIITGQEPAAKTMVRQGETVVVNVSAGPQIVNVPYVIGDSVAQATQALQAAGFQVQVNRYGPFDKVFDYSPSTPTAPRNSVIVLDVGY